MGYNSNSFGFDHKSITKAFKMLAKTSGALNS